MTHQRIAEHIEIEWLDRQSQAAAACPCCAYQGPVKQYIDIDYQPPEARHRFILQICPACGVRFVDNTHTMDYSSDNLIEIGWHIYQIQLGAGVWPISAPLTRLAKPAAAKVLEIGGAYGFGLDFCIRARGWQGVGFDPSPLAAFGARELGLTVTQDYFEEKNLSSGPYDVIIATEVIEHLEHPPEFLSLMRQAVADDGILVLSTPDAALITPALPAGQLMPLLSPGAHIVLQTAESLEKALLAAGFTEVKIKSGGLSLVAYASPSPFSLNEDEAAGRASYRHYLVERSKLTDEMSDLRLGFAGRGYFEACNDGDLPAAEAAWAALVPAVKARFGLDLACITALPAGAEDCSLAELCEKMPLGLGMILFSRAMYLLSRKTDRAALRGVLVVAKQAAAALLDALAKRSLTDGLTASLAGIIDLEIALCLAEAGDADCLPVLIALGSGHDGETRAWRGFTGLVNAGALELAAQLQAELKLALPDAALPADLRRDVLLSLANFVLAPGGDTPAAFGYALALRALKDEPAATAIILQAFTRLVNASRYKEALAAAAKYEVDRLAMLAGDETHGQDAKLARMILDLAAGDPAIIPGRLQDLTLPPEQRAKLLLEAFIRLVNFSRLDEARAFIIAHDVPGLMVLAGGESAKNAGLAQIVIELAEGDPGEVPGRVAGLELEPVQRSKILLEAFIRLVNASRYTEAVAFVGEYDVPALAALAGGVVARNTALSRIMLDLATGAPEQVAARLAGLDVTTDIREKLLLEAFVRMVNAGRYDDALAFSATHNTVAMAGRATGALAQNAGLAQVILNLAAGDPAAVPGQLAGLGLPTALRARLLLEAFVRLVNARRFTEAKGFEAGQDIAALAGLVPDELGRDTRVALLTIEIYIGDPLLAAARLVDFALPEAVQDRLLTDIFVRLVNASRYEEALRFTETQEIAARAARLGGDAAQDAGLARIVLDLAAGDPADVPARLAGAALAPALRTKMLLEAFIRLVNAGRYAEAAAYQVSYDVPGLAAQAAGKLAQDTGIARIVLDLAAGDPADVPARLQGLDLPAALAARLRLEAFIRLVNASRYVEAQDFMAQHDVAALAALAGGKVAQDTGFSRIMLDLAVGDPALVPARLTGLEMPRALRDTLLLEAFVRLVNAGRIAEAQAYAQAHAIQSLLARNTGTAVQNTRLALVMLDLAAGDPALVPARLAGLDIPAAMRRTLLLEAFIRLVNASRYEEAQAFITAHGVPALAEAVGGVTATDTGLARIMLDLAVGDPAAVPARLAGLDLPVALAGKMLLETFVRLVNASRFAEAQGFITAHDVPALLRAQGGEVAANAAIGWAVLELASGDAALVPARLALAMVPPERAQALLFGAFTGLVNQGRYDDAETLAAAADLLGGLALANGPAAQDARVAAILLELARGRTQAACAQILRTEALDGETKVLQALLVDGFVRLINEGSYEAARPLAANRGIDRRLAACKPASRHDGLAALLMLELQPGGSRTRIPQLLDEAINAGLAPARLNGLALAAFATLVNGSDFATARLLRHVVDPLLLRMRPPFDEAGRNAMFAAGILALQERGEWRRSVTLFARLRDDLVKAAPPGAAPGPLFWPAMRGEVLALHRLDRSAEVTALLQSFVPAYADAPDDLRAQLGEQV